MDSEIKQVSRSVYTVISPEGATNFGIVKASNGSAILIDIEKIHHTGFIDSVWKK